jgi:hypothetical protein
MLYGTEPTSTNCSYRYNYKVRTTCKLYPGFGARQCKYLSENVQIIKHAVIKINELYVP